MSTLREIQQLVNEAQDKIAAGDRVFVQRILWPEIKGKLGQTNMERLYRQDMGRLIYKYLNEQGLSKAPTSISLESLEADLRTGRVKATEPEQVYKWLAW
jgi:hypothetical protein